MSYFRLRELSEETLLPVIDTGVAGYRTSIDGIMLSPRSEWLGISMTDDSGNGRRKRNKPL